MRTNASYSFLVKYALQTCRFVVVSGGEVVRINDLSIEEAGFAG